MPGLRFLGRTWLIAGDDLAVPFAIGAQLRATGLGILVAFAFSFAGDVECETVTCAWLFLPDVGCVSGYIGVSIALMAVTALLEACIAMSASKGSIMDDKPRHALPPLLITHAAVNVLEMLLTYWAARSFWDDALRCSGVTPHEETEAQRVLHAVVWLQVISISMMVLGASLSFDLSGSVDVNDVDRLNR